jgi:hypothetical protein
MRSGNPSGAHLTKVGVRAFVLIWEDCVAGMGSPIALWGLPVLQFVLLLLVLQVELVRVSTSD